MTDITPPDINRLEAMHAVFPTVWNRAFNGYYTVSGGAITQSGTPDMKSNLASGWKGYIDGVYTEVAATDATHDAADGSNDRIDIVYITAAGAFAIHKGTAAATSAIDPDDPTNWHKFRAPYPADSIPAGVILALVRIPAAATTVTTANIWEIGAKRNHPPIITLRKTVTHADGANTSLGTCPAHCILMYAAVSCGETWNGSSPTIDIGTSEDADAIFAASEIGMTSGDKETRFHPLGDDGIESATEYFADVVPDGSTEGETTITLLFASFV